MNIAQKNELSWLISKKIFIIIFIYWLCPWHNSWSAKIEVNEFELLLLYYVHFQTNALVKRYAPAFPLSYGLNDSTAILLQVWLWY